MQTLHTAKPVIAVDLTAKRKQEREEDYVPQSVNGREWHFNTAGEASPEPRDTPTLPIRVVAGEIARAVDEGSSRTTITSGLSVGARTLETSR